MDYRKKGNLDVKNQVVGKKLDIVSSQRKGFLERRDIAF